MQNPTENELSYAAYCQEVISKLHRFLVANRRFPHPDQGAVLKALFAEGRKVIMGQCGRSFGKTQDNLYIAWRMALTHPNSEGYIICPEIKQAKKIYWLPRRLQNYGPREFILDEWESKLQLVFKNGAHIILDGCENFDSLRGIKPDWVIYDEFQHHTKFFDEEVMQPNLSRGDVALVVMGTPPKRDCYYVEFRNDVLEKIAQGHKDYFYVELPSSCNPILDKNWLAEKKADLFKKGKQNVWFREYEGKLVFDTESAIFPMFDKSRMVFSPQWIAERIARDRRKLQYFAIFDPGTATCFAVLFAAINPYTSDVFLLDEIYETRRENTSAMRIWQRANKIKERFNDDQNAWTNIYDEAAAWFENEVRREAPDQDFLLIPTRKQRRNTVDGEEGRPGESLIMASMMASKLHISAECEKFVWEVEQYVRDELGNYPLTNDHLIDDLFYLYLDSGYSLRGESDTEETEDQERRSRPETFSQLVDRELNKRDYARDLGDDIYDSEDISDIWN